jgi:purine nucleosidase
MHICGQTEIPIHRGVEPHKRGGIVSDFFWGPDGFGGALHEFKQQQENGEIKMRDIQEEQAVEYLIRMSKEHIGEITLISLAPMSNIAEAVRRDEDFPKRIKNVVMMGGTYLGQGNSEYYSSEFNIFKDPEGAALVFDSFDDITMLPVEATFF